MNDILSWICPGIAYIVVMKGGAQHCVIVSSVDEKWITGFAGISKTVCLYEEENKNLKLIVDSQDSVVAEVSNKPCRFLQKSLISGPEMIVRFDEITIIEKTKATILSEDCFDEDGVLIEENVVKNMKGLEVYWTQEDGFNRTKEEWRTI